jgi:hypothetical protein
MTLMKGHQHFTKTYFKALLPSVLKDVKIISIEAHVYPMSNKSLLRFMHILEDLLGKIPFFKDYLSYNIAIAKNKNQSKKEIVVS